ncbi:hypothetical protein G9A89_007388 [Geosiphon pyriformis]|nr:hypothetical protein G9A89_007388 [Geosiphon pyriformis]
MSLPNRKLVFLAEIEQADMNKILGEIISVVGNLIVHDENSKLAVIEQPMPEHILERYHEHDHFNKPTSKLLINTRNIDLLNTSLIEVVGQLDKYPGNFPKLPPSIDQHFPRTSNNQCVQLCVLQGISARAVEDLDIKLYEKGIMLRRKMRFEEREQTRFFAINNNYKT